MRCSNKLCRYSEAGIMVVTFNMQASQLTFTSSNSTKEALKKVRNMLKINNKNTMTTSLTSFFFLSSFFVYIFKVWSTFFCFKITLYLLEASVLINTITLSILKTLHDGREVMRLFGFGYFDIGTDAIMNSVVSHAVKASCWLFDAATR